jgi:recombinase
MVSSPGLGITIRDSRDKTSRAVTSDPKSRHPVKRSRRELDPVEAPVVRRIFDLVGSGRSFKATMEILIAEHAASPRDQGWTEWGGRADTPVE